MTTDSEPVHSVSDVLDTVDLSEFDAFTGDCANIAVALQRVFGGELVASYANTVDFHDGYPAHFAVRINGVLYDAGGETSRDALRDRAYYGTGTADWDAIRVCDVNAPQSHVVNENTVQVIETRFRNAERSVETGD